MGKKLSYPCGCSFNLIDDDSSKLLFSPKIESINLECQRTWDLISDGNTKGCFQLESRLGRTIAKKLKPENIEQLSALIAILRPGTLEAIRNGKSVTNHYIDKKKRRRVPGLLPSCSRTHFKNYIWRNDLSRASYGNC